MSLYKKIFMIAALIIAAKSQAGSLLYRDVDSYIKPGCVMNTNTVGSVSSPYYVKTLVCNGASVVTLSGSSINQLTPSYVASGYNLAVKTRSSDAARLFTISVSSVANVFANRPKSANYLEYSDEGILDQPIILVEGYDPDNINQPTPYYYKRGFDRLVYNNKDLIIVNFPDGAASIDDNAALLKDIILEIGAAKAGDIPMTIIGYSMGGIIARKALKNMEDTGVDHKVSLFISYDAPQLGANVPVSIIGTVDKVIAELDRKLFGYTPDNLKWASRQYKNPAAQEMLIAGSRFQNATASMFPKNLARVAVTSGSVDGALQQPSVYKSQLVWDFKISFFDNSLGSWSVSDQWISQNRGTDYYDNVPGSYLYQFDLARSKWMSSGKSITSYNQFLANNKITFVPTISALAMNVSPSASGVKQNFARFSPFDKYIAADGTSQCSAGQLTYSDGTGQSYNYPHDLFDYSQITQVKCAINEFQKAAFVIPDRSFKLN